MEGPTDVIRDEEEEEDDNDGEDVNGDDE